MDRIPSPNLEPEIQDLFRAIHRYDRLTTRYLRNPGVKLRLEEAFERLIDALESPVVKTRLEIILAACATDGDQTMLTLSRQLKPADMKLEIAMSQIFGLKPARVARAITLDSGDQTPIRQIMSPEDLIEATEDFHEQFLEEAEKSRSISGRVVKKKRKRNLGQAATSIMFGTGCAILNTYLWKTAIVPEMATSWGATMAAFGLAARDIVGEPVRN